MDRGGAVNATVRQMVWRSRSPSALRGSCCTMFARPFIEMRTPATLASAAAGDDMSNRQQRRVSLAQLKRDAAQGHMDTYLIPTDISLDGQPLLRDAALYWRSGIHQRRPTCFGCAARFADDARPAAFLFAVPSVAPSSASVSGLCITCWGGLSDAEVEAAALGVMRKIQGPRARFRE